MKPLYQKYSSAEFDKDGHFIGFSLHYDENYNFAYDVVDEIARQEPDKKAVVWCDEYDNEKILTFREISELSSKAANFFLSQGITDHRSNDSYCFHILSINELEHVVFHAEFIAHLLYSNLVKINLNYGIANPNDLPCSENFMLY